MPKGRLTSRGWSLLIIACVFGACILKSQASGDAVGPAAIGPMAQDKKVRVAWELQVKLSLKVLNEETLVGLPVVVQLTVENPSKKIIAGVPLTYGYDHIFVTRGDSTTDIALTQRWEGYSRVEHTIGPVSKDLAPGDSLMFGYFLVDNDRGPMSKRGFLFNQPGEYKIKQVIQVDLSHHAEGLFMDKKEGEIVNETNEVSLKVVAPTGEDKEALSLIEKLPIKMSAYWWPNPSSRFATKANLEDELSKPRPGVDLMKQLLDKFPRSRYAKYARFYVVKDLFHSSLYSKNDDGELAVHSEDRLKQSMDMMNELLNDPDEVICPQILGDFTSLGSVEGGRFKQLAKEKFQQLVQKYSHTDFFLNEWGYKTLNWK